MSIDEDFVIILAKKLGYLEKRVTYLEGKCRGQQGTIEKLQKKARKFRKKCKSRDQQKRIVRKVLEDSVDLKPDVDSIQISKSNQNLKGNFEVRVSSVKNDKKLSQKVIVQMGIRCEKPLLLLTLNSNEAIDGKRKIPQSKPCMSTRQDSKIVQVSSKPKGSLKKSHTCSYCSKSFQNFSYLSRHIRFHTGERPFACKICSKSFKKSDHLKAHNRIHTGERPFPCSFCSKSFAQYRTQIEHLRIHKGERPFSCSICPKTFTQSSALQVHKRIHTGEKPHSCSFCGKKFSRSGALKRHEKIHVREIST